MRHVWPLGVLLFLSGCASQSIPRSDYVRRTFLAEWNTTPLTLLESVESYPVVYRSAAQKTDATQETGGKPVPFAAPAASPAPPAPDVPATPPAPAVPAITPAP